MERRDRSLKALREFIYIDSLDSFTKADALVKWYDEYLKDDSIENFVFELNELKQLEELFFKNLNFLNQHKEETRQELIKIQKVKRFLKN